MPRARRSSAWGGQSRSDEPGAPQATRIARAARTPFPVGEVAGDGEREIHAERRAAPDDLRLREPDDRRVQLEPRALHRGLRREVREPLERRDELRPAIWIARVVD